MAITIQAVKRKDRNTVEPAGDASVTGVRGIATAVGLIPSVSNGAALTHGRDITAANTGHTAYFDTGLGRNIVDGDLTVHAAAVSMSDFVANGGTITKRWFQGGLTVDRSNVTVRACKFEGGVSGYVGGTHRPFNLDYCTIDTSGAAGDDGIHYQDYTANRCRIGGHSDGAKINGNCVLTECYIRTESQDALDHNDGLQAFASYAGSTVQRCNIDCRPVNGSGGANAALFAADNSTGLMTWQDNWLAGGGYTMRCYENCTYIVTGNDILVTGYIAPVHRAVIPQSNLLSWSNNRTVDGSGNLVATIPIP